MSVNDSPTETLSLIELSKTNTLTKRPIKMIFHKSRQEKNISLIFKDPRKLPWINRFLSSNFDELTSSIVVSYIMVLNICELYLENLNFTEIEYKELIEKQVKFVLNSSLMDTIINEIPIEILHSMIHIDLSLSIHEKKNLNKISKNSIEKLRFFLIKKLENLFFDVFSKSTISKQMSGWLNRSPRYHHFSVIDLLNNSSLIVFFYLFHCELHRFLFF
jgi:hypothetical protein